MSDEEIIGKIKKGAGKSADAAEKVWKKVGNIPNTLEKRLKIQSPEMKRKNNWGLFLFFNFISFYSHKNIRF